MAPRRGNFRKHRPPRPESSRDRTTAYEKRKREKARERWWHANRPPAH